jgi:hypothetical protein
MTTQSLASAPLTEDRTRTFTWSALANGDTGAPVDLYDAAAICFSVSGTFGSGGSITLQGSLDGTNFYALTDRQGVAITLTAAGLKQAQELPRYVRPNCTAGDGTTALVPIIRARRN